MLEETSLLCERLISPLKLWLLLPLNLSDINPESSCLPLLSSVSLPLVYSHQCKNMLYCSSFKNPFLVFLFFFNYHLFLCFPSQQNLWKELHKLTLPHFLLPVPFIRSVSFHLQHPAKTDLIVTDIAGLIASCPLSFIQHSQPASPFKPFCEYTTLCGFLFLFPLALLPIVPFQVSSSLPHRSFSGVFACTSFRRLWVPHVSKPSCLYLNSFLNTIIQTHVIWYNVMLLTASPHLYSRLEISKLFL